MVFALAKSATPIDVLGLSVHLDPLTLLTSVVLPSGMNPSTLPLPISADPALIGGKLFVQSVHIDGPATLAASPGLSLTVL
jgi:hypothetical protein